MSNLNGKLTLTIAEAQYLYPTTYKTAVCKCQLASSKFSTVSSPYTAERGPVWNTTYTFVLEGKELFLELEVNSVAALTTNIGYGRVPLTELAANSDAWYRIGEGSNSQYVGEIRIKTHFDGTVLGVPREVKAPEPEPQPAPPVPEKDFGAASSAVLIPGVCVSRVSIGSYYSLMALNAATGNYFIWNARSGRWSQQPGSAASITVGADSDMWVTTPSQAIYRFNPSNYEWRRIPGKAEKIFAGGLNKVAILSKGEISIWKGSGISNFDAAQDEKQLWAHLPAADHSAPAVELGLAHDGALWAVHADKSIWQSNVDRPEWKRVAGTATQIGVGSAETVVIANPDSGIFAKYDPKTEKWVDFKVCLARTVDVAADGTFVAANPDQIFFGKC